ncbi:hypothetical protein [Falsiroseomonas sp.]|nr:hypothetical protein [Falsiroseomonas sp.]MDO9499896.1 hypothetical protein [Falsiroseomonas sp.]
MAAPVRRKSRKHPAKRLCSANRQPEGWTHQAFDHLKLSDAQMK